MMRKRVLSGMRPSGRLHLGNYLGALSEWIKLQNQHECFFMVADWHALTTEYASPGKMGENIREMIIDWLSAGLDPDRCVIFRQSDVPEHAEMGLMLSMITPLGWLERNPTYKEQLREMADREITTHGFLGYPVLQAADILLYKADIVPVGEDQLPHLELTREIARRFNHLFGETFVEPQALVSATPKLPGVDGRKMSKSYGNTVEMSASPEQIKERVMQMFTDPQKIRATDLGHPEGCVVYAFHKVYNPASGVREEECRTGKIGCVACKQDMIKYLDSAVRPISERRWDIERADSQKGIVKEILNEGKNKARAEAAKTLGKARQAMGVE